MAALAVSEHTMKKYKKTILSGLKKRGFDLLTINGEYESIPWWIEELWTIKRINSHLPGEIFYIFFLTDKLWESGNKNVEEVLFSSSLMNDYQDRESKIVNLDMRKGNFEMKLEKFWNDLDNKMNTLANMAHKPQRESSSGK